MPAIFAALLAVIPNLFAYFLTFFGRKYTVATATVLAYIATTVAMIVCINNLIQSIVVLIVIPPWISTAIAWFMPSNAVGILSAILASNVCHSSYRIVIGKIKLVNSAS